MNREITEADLREIAIAALELSPSPKSDLVQQRINSHVVSFFELELAHEGAICIKLSIRDFLYVEVIHVPKDNFIHIDANSDLPFNHLKGIQKAAALGLVTLEATEAEAGEPGFHKWEEAGISIKKCNVCNVELDQWRCPEQYIYTDKFGERHFASSEDLPSPPCPGYDYKDFIASQQAQEAGRLRWQRKKQK